MVRAAQLLVQSKAREVEGLMVWPLPHAHLVEAVLEDVTSADS